MSVKVMSMVWDSKLPRDQKYILLCLADFGNDEGKSIYPAVGYIAWKTGYSDRRVQEILSDLRTRGIVGVDFEGSEYGTNEYTINLSKIPTREPYRPPKNGRPTKPGAKSAPGLENPVRKKQNPVRKTAEPGAKSAPNTLDKPLDKPLDFVTPDGVTGKQISAFNPTQDIPTEFSDTPEGRAKARIAKALSRGDARDFEIKEALLEHLHISPNWEFRPGKMFLEWLKERPEDETIEDFAQWWYAKDWRGKRGQNPTYSQVMEFWPGAFAHKRRAKKEEWTQPEIDAFYKAMEASRKAKADEAARASGGLSAPV